MKYLDVASLKSGDFFLYNRALWMVCHKSGQHTVAANLLDANHNTFQFINVIEVPNPFRHISDDNFLSENRDVLFEHLEQLSQEFANKTNNKKNTYQKIQRKVIEAYLGEITDESLSLVAWNLGSFEIASREDNAHFKVRIAHSIVEAGTEKDAIITLQRFIGIVK